MTAISLREAAKQLREQGEWHLRPVRGKRQLELNRGRDMLALATLLDGDGEGGLLGLHRSLQDGPLSLVASNYCSCRQYKAQRMSDGEMAIVPVEYPCPDLVDVAAYVSAVLGVEVTA